MSFSSSRIFLTAPFLAGLSLLTFLLPAWERWFCGARVGDPTRDDEPVPPSPPKEINRWELGVSREAKGMTSRPPTPPVVRRGELGFVLVADLFV